LDSVGAERSALPGGKERVAGLTWAFVHPGSEQLGGGRHQRCAAFTAAFAVAVQVGACSELHVLAAQTAQLGDSQPGLDGDGEQGVVPAADPPAAVGGGEQCFGFGTGEERHIGSIEAFGRYGRHPLDESGMFGMA
jgi:hypothetical protein